jgi:hypothetical protein
LGVTAITEIIKTKLVGINSKVSKSDEIYGIPIEQLSWLQRQKAHEFVKYVEPWLLDHLGNYGIDWHVEIDKDADSFRLQFKDQETETYFMLAWMHGAKNSDTDDAQS